MSFLTGFATGLAKSVDTQLKESIERTRDNIDMVSKWRLKKAEEREKERRAKDKEIEQLIKDAAFVIGGDQNNVRHQNIAAALYKERGLSGFTSDIEVMRAARDKGQSPIDFLERASTDVPTNTFSLSEIVRSLSDAESSFAPSDMIFPKGTIKGSGLISALVPDFDATAAGAAQAKDQMKQIGFTTTPTATSLSFDRYTFDRESLGYATKSVNEKLSYLRNIMDDPSADPDLATKAGERLNELLNKSMTGEEGSAIQAINLKLSRLATQDTSAMSEMQFKAFDAEQNALIERRQTLEDTIALRDAKTQKERLAIQADIAFRKGDEEEGFRLQYEAEDQGGMTTYNTLIQRVNSRILRNKDDEDYKNSTGDFKGKGLKEDQASIQAFKFLEQESNGVPFEKIEAFAGYIRRAALNEFKAAHPSMYKDLNVSAGEDGLVDADAFVAAVTGAGADATRKYNDILATVAQRYKTIGAKHGVSENTIDSAITLVTGTGLPDVSGDATGIDAQTDTAFQANVDATDRDEQLQQEQSMLVRNAPSAAQIAELEGKYPNNKNGATSIVADLVDDGQSLSEIVAAVPDIHDDAFTNSVQQAVAEVESVVASAVEGNLDQTLGSLTLTGPKTVQVSPAAKSNIVKAVADDLSISGDAAERLIDQKVAEINAPIRMNQEDALVPENVMKVLEREKLLNLFGNVPGRNRRDAVLAVADAFNIQPADAESFLDRALRANQPDAPETVDQMMKRLNADVVLEEDAIASLLKGRPTFPPRSGPVPYRRIGDKFFEIKENGTLSDEPASASITRELLKKLGGDSSDVNEEVATETIKKTKLNPVQLAMKFVDGTITEEETIALKKAVQGEGGAELANAIKMIRDRRAAEKQVSAYKSRGGLMSR